MVISMVFLPAGMVTVAGNVMIDGFDDVRVMTVPPAGATPFNVTRHFVEMPPVMLGDIVMPLTASGLTESVADFVTPPKLAVMTAEIADSIVTVVMPNEAIVAPS